MPRDGNGTMSLVHNWEDDKTNGIKILASRMMAQQDDIADELTNSVDKDGQTVWTGDMNAGDRKIGNYGQTTTPTLRDDVPFLGMIQDQAGVFFAASGINDIGIQPVPAFNSYSDGKVASFRATASNTGAMTINVSGLGAKSIKKLGGTTLDSGDISENGMYQIQYNNSTGVFEMTNASAGGGVSRAEAYYLGTS
jgi:hypothetical protein